MVALLVCLIPTTIGGLLSAIGIAGMDRLIAQERARHERPRGRGGGRRGHAAARQDRHHHPRQPHGGGVPPRRRACAMEDLAERRAARRAWRTRRPRAAPSWCWPRSSYKLRPRRRCRRTRRAVRAVHRATRMSGVDLDGRAASARARPTPSCATCEAQGGTVPPELDEPARSASARRAARRWSSPTGARVLGRRPPEGRGEGRHQGALRPLPRDGHPHGDDHRRQPAHRRGDRARGRRGRLPRRGHARGEDGAHPGASRPRASWWP